MSWLAEKNATSTPNSAIISGLPSGSVVPSPIRVTISASWVATIQPRRRPNHRVSGGSGSRSMTGAQANFSV